MRLVSFVFLLVLPFSVLGQAYPSKPVRLIVPFPPGGGFDGIARPFAEKLGTALGQPVVVENKPGAAGNIGAAFAAQQPADGYTLLFANDFLATNPPMYKTTGYDPLKDFAPISRVGTTPTAIAANPNLQAKDAKELAVLSKKKPLNFGTPGIGSVPHLVGELINLEGAMALVHVPYKGTGPAITDTIGGQIELVITTLSSLTPHIRAGKLRGIAVVQPKRADSMPELPTLAESGGPAISAEIWYGLFVPAGVPADIRKRLHEASVQALAQADLVERLKKAGYEVGSSSPEALGTLLKGELGKWTRVVNDAKIPRD